jgi:hypothetical protein
MRAMGFVVDERDQDAPGGVEAQAKVPAELNACHTAVVEGYVIQGHVPAEDVTRLLAERPSDIVGLGVQGMPVGSPGMEIPGEPNEPYEVIAFFADGKTEVFARH